MSKQLHHVGDAVAGQPWVTEQKIVDKLHLGGLGRQRWLLKTRQLAAHKLATLDARGKAHRREGQGRPGPAEPLGGKAGSAWV